MITMLSDLLNKILVLTFNLHLFIMFQQRMYYITRIEL